MIKIMIIQIMAFQAKYAIKPGTWSTNEGRAEARIAFNILPTPFVINNALAILCKRPFLKAGEINHVDAPRNPHPNISMDQLIDLGLFIAKAAKTSLGLSSAFGMKPTCRI